MPGAEFVRPTRLAAQLSAERGRLVASLGKCNVVDIRDSVDHPEHRVAHYQALFQRLQPSTGLGLALSLTRALSTGSCRAVCGKRPRRTGSARGARAGGTGDLCPPPKTSSAHSCLIRPSFACVSEPMPCPPPRRHVAAGPARAPRPPRGHRPQGGTSSASRRSLGGSPRLDR